MNRTIPVLLTLAILLAACGSSRHAFEACDDAHPCDTGLSCLPTRAGSSTRNLCTRPCSEGCTGLSDTRVTCYSGELDAPMAFPTPVCTPDCSGEPSPGAYCGQFAPWINSANLSADGTRCWCM